MQSVGVVPGQCKTEYDGTRDDSGTARNCSWTDPTHDGPPPGCAFANVRKPVGSRYDYLCLSAQDIAQPVGVLVAGTVLRAHDEGSNTWRNAAMPRDAWLLTAPWLMPMALAMSASDKSA